MDIQKLSIESAQTAVKDKVGTALLSKSLDMARADADGLLRLMTRSAAGNAPLPEGSGGAVDIVV
jgi:hypothetical protein